MASRSDQLHSHQFTLQRAVGALAMRDPDPVSSPLRRIGGALFAGVMLAAIAVAAVGVYGVLRPGGGDSWRDGNSMIIESETGARFVYRDGVLYPALNHTSALLILGRSAPSTVHVTRSQLVGVPRGTPLGIAGAPDPLPGPQQLVTEAWTVCSRAAAAAPGAASAGVESVLRVGGPAATDPLGARAVLAADPGGQLHLLWNGRRFPLTDPDLVMGAFVWSRASAVAVPAAVLNAIPPGADLGRVGVPSGTRPSPVDGYRIGEVVVASDQSGNRSFSVVVEDGLADITPVQAGLILADKARGQAEATDMPQSVYGNPGLAHRSLKPTGEGAPPERTPEQVRPAAAGGVCATFAPGAPTTLSVPATVAPAPGEVRVRRAAGEPGVIVDWVAVPPGRGAVVEALAGPSAPNGALAIVSDLGLRFAVPSREVLATLGYPDVTPQRLPAALVALVPSGRALDPAAALLPAA
jgi:type VII secretion protein EccB